MACRSCGAAASSRVGNSVNTAIVFGDPAPEVYRVRVMQDMPGLQGGAIKYVRGTNVQQLVDDGYFTILSGGTRAAVSGGITLYYVGDVGYTTLEAARVRSGQTGEEIVVRAFGG